MKQALQVAPVRLGALGEGPIYHDGSLLRTGQSGRARPDVIPRDPLHDLEDRLSCRVELDPYRPGRETTSGVDSL